MKIIFYRIFIHFLCKLLVLATSITLHALHKIVNYFTIELGKKIRCDLSTSFNTFPPPISPYSFL